MSWKSEILILKDIQRIWGLLSVVRKRQVVFVFFAQTLTAGLEAAMAFSIAVFTAFSMNPETLVNDSRFQFVIAEVGAGNSILMFLMCAMIVATVSKVSFGIFSAYMQARLVEDISVDVGIGVMRAIMAKPYLWHLDKNSSDLLLTVQWRQYAGILFSDLLQIGFNSMLVGILLTGLLLASPQVLVPMLIVGTLGGMCYKLFRRMIDLSARDYYLASLVINALVGRGTNGIKELVVFNGQSFLDTKISQKLFAAAPHRARQKFYALCPTNLLEVIVVTLLGLFALYLFVLSDTKQEEAVAMLSLLAVSGWRLVPAANRIITNLSSVRQSVPYTRALADYLDTDSARTPPKPVGQALGLRRSLMLQDITLRYESGGPLVLDGLNTEIAAFETVGIVGQSGSGKSSLLHLLLGLIPPTCGYVLVDGVPICADNLSEWRQTIGYVPQSPYLADASLAENIAFGISENDIDYEWISECCRLASIDFLQDLPQGFDTVIGERGSMLSGGQCQRVAIARALYHKPDVLIFDEATSALDAQNERIIREALQALSGKVTMIFVAHRLSTLKECDRVLWLDGGRIVRDGPPEEVLLAYEQASY